MKVDRYTKIVLTIIAAGLWTLILMAVVSPRPAVASIGLAGGGGEQLSISGLGGSDYPLHIDLTCHGC